MTRLDEMYANDASEQWFSGQMQRDGSVHQSLRNAGFRVWQREEALSAYEDLDIPFLRVRASWGDLLPAPLPGFQTAFFLEYPVSLSSHKHEGRGLNEILDGWLGQMRGTERYLLSLNRSEYLFASSDAVRLRDVLSVTREWDLDCYVGVFDDTQDVMFVFDAEFGIVYVSYRPGCEPSDFLDLAKAFNPVFANEYVSGAKLRTGADPERAREYFDEAFEPCLRA